MDSAFLSEMQELIRQETSKKNLSVDVLRNCLVCLKGHTLRLQARSKRLLYLGAIFVSALPLLKFLGIEDFISLLNLFLLASAFFSWIIVLERGQNFDWIVRYEEFALLIEREIERRSKD